MNEIEEENSGRLDVNELPIVKEKRKQCQEAATLAKDFNSFDHSILAVLKQENIYHPLKENQMMIDHDDKPLFRFK